MRNLALGLAAAAALLLAVPHDASANGTTRHAKRYHAAKVYGYGCCGPMVRVYAWRSCDPCARAYWGGAPVSYRYRYYSYYASPREFWPRCW
jgi:hypothetical protein